jgi:hypothetical protein
MEAIIPSETSVDFHRSACSHIPEHRTLPSQRCGNIHFNNFCLVLNIIHAPVIVWNEPCVAQVPRFECHWCTYRRVAALNHLGSSKVYKRSSLKGRECRVDLSLLPRRKRAEAISGGVTFAIRGIGDWIIQRTQNSNCTMFLLDYFRSRLCAVGYTGSKSGLRVAYQNTQWLRYRFLGIELSLQPLHAIREFITNWNIQYTITCLVTIDEVRIDNWIY